MFHTDLLTPYQETKMHGENYSRPAPELIDDQEEYVVEHIIDSRRHGRGRKLQYLVKWEGYPDSDNQWIGKGDIFADKAIWDFKLRNPCKEVHIKGPPAKSLSSSSHLRQIHTSHPHMYSTTAHHALLNATFGPSQYSTTSEEVIISQPEADVLITTNEDNIHYVELPA